MIDDRHIEQESGSLADRIRTGAVRWRRRARALASSGDTSELLRMFAGGAWRRGRDLAPLDATLFPYNRYIHRWRTGTVPRYRVLPFELPSGVRHVGDTRFVISLDRITTYCGFSYADEGWHPFLRILQEYDHEPSLRYADSTLRRLYEALTPATVLEAIFDDGDEHSGLSPLHALPAVHEVLKSLWQLDRRGVSQLVSGAPYGPHLDDHSRYLGPKTHAVGADHFARVLSMYESVRQHGYDPARFGGGRPRGYFLVHDGDYRFVMSRGNHRVPALRHLGYEELVATVRVHHPPVVDRAKLELWSTDHGGPYPLSTAERLFDRMFTTTGAERAAALGLD